MSIYPVRIKTFFPPTDRSKDNIHLRYIIKTILKFAKCEKCGKKVKMRNGWCFHALPWGYDSEVWCSKHCLYGDRESR